MTAPTASAETTARSLLQRDWHAWTRTNLRRLAIGGGAVVVVGLAIVAYVASERRKEAFAASALSQAWGSVEAGNMPLAANDLSRLVERFGGTRAADEGMILLSEIRMLSGEGVQAVRGLQTFVEGRHPRYVMASAYALLGSGLEQQNQFREAAEAFRKATAAAELDFLKAEYLVDVGRTAALAGDTAGAKAAYNEVLTRYGRLAQSAEARVRMAEIGGEVPPLPPEPDTTGSAG